MRKRVLALPVAVVLFAAGLLLAAAGGSLTEPAPLVVAPNNPDIVAPPDVAPAGTGWQETGGGGNGRSKGNAAKSLK